jgi:hypothetical protein
VGKYFTKQEDDVASILEEHNKTKKVPLDEIEMEENSSV